MSIDVSSRLPVAVRAGALARRAPAWTITAVLGLCYVVAAPSSADLAAASYRADLFGRVGFTLWDNGWYGGHHLPAYSVLAPVLGWLIGPLALAAVSMTIAAALFSALIDGRFSAPAVRIAGVWFALGAAIGLLASRVPFDLGLAIGLSSLVLAQRGRRAPALALAAVCALTSPVAGAFLALAALAWALADRRRRFPPMLVAAALLPIAAGDAFAVRAGCDKRFSTCDAKFANVMNFQGFPDIPGDDFLAVNAATSPRNDGASRRAG